MGGDPLVDRFESAGGGIVQLGRCKADVPAGATVDLQLIGMDLLDVAGEDIADVTNNTSVQLLANTLCYVFEHAAVGDAPAGKTMFPLQMQQCPQP